MSDVAVWSAAQVTVNAGGIDIDQDAIGTEDFVTEDPQEKAFKLRMAWEARPRTTRTLVYGPRLR
jgi:hypothetical protein